MLWVARIIAPLAPCRLPTCRVMLWVVWGGLGCAGHCPHHLHRLPLGESAGCQPFGAVWCPMNNLQVTNLQGYDVGCLDWLEYRPHRLYRSPINILQVANCRAMLWVVWGGWHCPHHCTACPMNNLQVANLQGYAAGCLDWLGIVCTATQWKIRRLPTCRATLGVVWGGFGCAGHGPHHLHRLPHEQSAGCQPAGLCLDWVEYRPHRLYCCPPCKICRLPTCRAIWVVWGGLVSLAARLPHEQSAGYQPAGLCLDRVRIV